VLAEHLLPANAAPSRLAVTPDGSAVICFWARSVHVCPIEGDRPARRITVAMKDVRDVALHPSGQWLVSVCDSPEVSVWDTATWKRVRSFDWGIGNVRCAAVSPDGCLAAVGGETGEVGVWDWEP
jgi:WD40 repeat protein